MPTTVTNAFAASGLTPQNPVRWGDKLSTKASGVYIISLTPSQSDLADTLTDIPLEREAFESWLGVCPELKLDGKRPTIDELMDRIDGFWLPDEVILYVGLATSLRSRLRQYYTTSIGARRPHSGGYFLKLLSNLNQLWVHYAETTDQREAENQILEYFCGQVSQESKQILHDPAHPFPFANLEWPPHVRKQHGLLGARASG
jgi:hypothetical protein